MKGLSPLIATVILIGLTIVVAGILGVWASSFVSQRLETFQNTTPKCDVVNFQIFKCTKSNNSITVIIDNKSPVSLNGFRFIFVYADGTVETKDNNETAEANSLKTYKITDISLENIDTIIARPIECTAKELRFSC